MIHDIIVLAKSRKHGGYCVAGIDLSTGLWFRPVSEHTVHGDFTDTLYDEDIECTNGRELECLDVIRFDLGDELPERYADSYQKENRLLLGTPVYRRHMSLEEVLNLNFGREIEDGRIINQSVLSGRKKLFGSNFAQNSINYPYNPTDYSLTFAEVENLKIYPLDGHHYSKADFIYHSSFRNHSAVNYREMSVTDPEYDSVEEPVFIRKAYCVISTGLPYNNRIYKYVAAVYPVDN